MRVVRGGEERTVGGGRRARGEREAELQRNDIPIPITFNGKERKKETVRNKSQKGKRRIIKKGE